MYDNFIIHSFNVYIVSNINDNKLLYSDVSREVFAYLPTAICDNINKLYGGKRYEVYNVGNSDAC